MMYALSYALGEVRELKHRHNSDIGTAKVMNSRIHQQAAQFTAYYSHPLHLAATTLDSQSGP